MRSIQLTLKSCICIVFGWYPSSKWNFAKQKENLSSDTILIGLLERICGSCLAIPLLYRCQANGSVDVVWVCVYCTIRTIATTQWNQNQTQTHTHTLTTNNSLQMTKHNLRCDKKCCGFQEILSCFFFVLQQKNQRIKSICNKTTAQQSSPHSSKWQTCPLRMISLRMVNS